MRRPRDRQRSRVYWWERNVADGMRDTTWRTVDEAAAWLKPIWRAERGRVGQAKVAMPLVERPSWGQRSAIAHHDHRITLPRWARNPWVLLHEAAHRLTPNDEAHGPRFVGVLIGLVCRHAGYDAAVLMAAADERGVRYHVRSIGPVPVIPLYRKARALVDERGPMSEMALAVALDVSYLQARAAAMTLIRRGEARWFRRKLQLTEEGA